MRMHTLAWALPMAAGLAARCCCATKVETQAPVPYIWRSVKVGGGGFIPGIVFSHVERGLAYLRSDMGGAYRWDAAQKTWIPMHDQFAESSYFGTESIAPDPINPNVVYIAVGMYRGDPSAILRSRDKGKTWQAFPVSFRMGGNEDGRGLGERLAVDPNDNRILYFGSRHDGLMRSANRGETWQKVASFPLTGRGLPGRGPTNGGLSFVVFDAASGRRGAATPTIFVASADPGPQHLFRSDDAGATWKPVAGEPKAELLPAKAEMDSNGVLYITYSNGIGPNGVTDGAVMKLDTRSGAWPDITPDKRPNRPGGGYMGISLDRQHPGTLGVTTMNRWGPVDTVWRSTDGGQTWADIVGKSTRDVSDTPFLKWGEREAKLGWWMSAFAIDPFNPNFAAYATGATIYATRNFADVNTGRNTAWFPWVNGIEQTGIITLMSPGGGAHLLSGFGDIGGFVHDDLTKSPPQGMYQNPQFGNTNTLDYAGQQPNVIVRSGRPSNGQAALAYSEDGGRSWQPLTAPAANGNGNADGNGNRNTNAAATPALITSADGKTFMLMTPVPQITRDHGQTWTPVQGLPDTGRPVADRVDPARFYALDFSNGTLFVSNDGGAAFSVTTTTGLPADISRDRPTWSEAAWPLHATNDQAGDLWLVSGQGLFHSGDGGKTFVKSTGTLRVESLSFGKAPQGQTYPALFAIGRQGDTRAIWRSDNRGATWIRLNDERHQWGTRFRCIAADPRVFGRVYIGTDGRGILYGEPVARS
jgi:xyloglucan-specific exo-beta-1,4-glucanase